MPVRKHRDHLIAFRVTDQELEYLEKACASRGRRSMSDFARTELLGVVSRQDSHSSGDLLRFEARLRQLEVRLLPPGSRHAESADDEVDPVPAAETR